MKRTELSGGVRERLVRLPAPYEHHYGVLPLPLPEEGIPLGEVTALHSQAQLALGQADEIARSLLDPYQISRILSRREAVSSSAMEGTHSTLDELLIADEGDDHAGQAVRQVRDYALAVAPSLTIWDSGFWIWMQVAMLIGFATSFLANRWLVRTDLKHAM